MRHSWLVSLAVLHVVESLSTLFTPCVLMVRLEERDTLGVCWMSLALVWWFFAGLLVNLIFWKDVRKTTSSTKVVALLHCLLGGLLWRLYLLKDGDDRQDDRHAHNATIRVEVASLKNCLSSMQSWPILFICLRFVLLEGLSLTTCLGFFGVAVSLLAVASSTSLTCQSYRDVPSNTPKSGVLYVCEPSTDPTSFFSSFKLVKRLRLLVIAQSFLFQLGRLVTMSCLAALFGFGFLVPVILVRFNLAWLHLIRWAPPELGRATWDTDRHRLAVARLTFLAYLTLFDWHVKRDDQCASNLGAGGDQTRHGLTYYGLSLVESIAVGVAWSLSRENTDLAPLVRGIEFASLGIGLHILSVLFALVVVFVSHRDRNRSIPGIITIDGYHEEAHVEFFGRTNPSMDFNENGEALSIPEPPKNTSSYVDFKDLDDDEVVLFDAGQGSVVTSPDSVNVVKRSPLYAKGSNPRSCKMGLHSLLLQSDVNFPHNVLPVGVKDVLKARRKSYETLSMASPGSELDAWRFPQRDLSVSSLASPFTRIIRTMSWPLIARPSKMPPVNSWVTESVRQTFFVGSTPLLQVNVSQRQLEVPEIKCQADDLYYV